MSQETNRISEPSPLKNQQTPLHDNLKQWISSCGSGTCDSQTGAGRASLNYVQGGARKSRPPLFAYLHACPFLVYLVILIAAQLLQGKAFVSVRAGHVLLLTQACCANFLVDLLGLLSFASPMSSITAGVPIQFCLALTHWAHCRHFFHQLLDADGCPRPGN